jgi:hypothetical protein
VEQGKENSAAENDIEKEASVPPFGEALAGFEAD